MVRTRNSFTLPTLSVVLLLLPLCVTPCVAVNAGRTDQFQEWYPMYGDIFEKIKTDNCSKKYASYLTGDRAGYKN
ncbi:hypothetical protein QBC35DRAFT_451073 [Podospora australis]|uniref:Secreted protein n=1 Tax=Podospora australis TaxID=1536484 RepID=A0AAN7AK80_9PEZI|nr:hypothetical protein QBC35DRAFT_451073 [Podospora australis]